MRDEQRGTLGIGVVARRTGLTPDVLRVWERRHRAVDPARSDGGTRLYTEREVRRLELLARLVSEGHRIGRLAKLEDEALELLFEPALETRSGLRAIDFDRPQEADQPPENWLSEAIDAVRAMDAGALEHQMTGLFLALGPRCFTLDIALPLLVHVGDLWAAGQLSIAAEHSATAVLRSLLGGALRHKQHQSGCQRVLFATPAGQRHEFGALAASVLGMQRGLDSIYLGPNLPCAELILAAEQAGAQAIVLGLHPGASGAEEQAVAEELALLREALPRDVVLCVGGCLEHPGMRVERVVMFDSLLAFDEALKEFGCVPSSVQSTTESRVVQRAVSEEISGERDAYAARVGDYYARIDTAARRVQDLHADRLVCRRGCSACCLDDLTVSPVEAERIQLAHSDLLRDAAPHPRGSCAFLDPEGACRIYTERPAVCRSQGLPLRVLFEDDEGEIAERRDICELNAGEGKPLDQISEEDCWLVGPFELELGAIERERFGEGAERIGLRSLFARSEG